MQREYCGCDVLTVLHCQCEPDLQLYDFRKHMMWGKHYSFNQSINFWDGLSNKLLPQWPHRATVVYKTRPGYESRNRCSLSRFLKVTSTGRSFHVQAPATWKAWRPIVGSLMAGTSRSSDEEDRSLCVYLEMSAYHSSCESLLWVEIVLWCCRTGVICCQSSRLGWRLERFVITLLPDITHICTLSVFCVCFSVGWQISHQ